MIKSATNFMISMLSILVVQGCAGTRTFHDVARAGDTVAVAAGWKQTFLRNNITVTITPSTGIPIVYPPNNPAIRAVANLYPDPVSSIIVSMETGQDLTTSAQVYGSYVMSNITGGDKEWWQTAVFIDLPSTLPVGTASINISNPYGESVNSTLQIVDGAGKPNTFKTTAGPLGINDLASLERVSHFTIDFAGGVIPYAIQIDLSHNPDVDHGGTGRTYVINPRGDIKNVTWSDNGSSLRVVITPAKTQALSSMLDYKFYVAGGIANLNVLSIKAVDSNGNSVSGVTASVD